jgi:hypothetical protein
MAPRAPNSFFADGFELGNTTGWTTSVAPPEPALVAHYRLNGNAYDSSLYGNHGTPLGGPTPAEDRYGRPGRAMLFDGANDQILVPDSNSLDISQDFTFAAWIRPFVTVGTFIFQKGETPSGHPVYAFDIASGTARGGFSGLPTSGSVQGCLPVYPDAWQLVVVTYDGVNLLAYVDGVVEGQADMSGSFVRIGDEDLEIGSYDATRFAGVMDDIRIMNRALSFREVQQLLN